MVYLIHFEHPYKHAQHYLGYCEPGGLIKRLARHRRGAGSRLMEIVTKAGIRWHCVRVYKNADRTEERRLKNYHRVDLCPVCKIKKSNAVQYAFGVVLS